MDGRDYLEVIESLAKTDKHEHNSPLASGDDTPPLSSRVGDPPPSHWGGLTSAPRTSSAAYLKFLGKQ